ncbi:MAG: hypothetical protein QOC99_2166 [Acidobacteriota bacterium]|nr:hypothetical protein [Acidobacteriota bacterium]
MSENYESVLEAARQLSPEQQRRLVERLLTVLSQTELSASNGRGKARRHFGVWDSGDERSADNDRIDLDLASEYGNTR